MTESSVEELEDVSADIENESAYEPLNSEKNYKPLAHHITITYATEQEIRHELESGLSALIRSASILL